ncbi:YeeE/YedE thiosulfate transporter family protein [Achromobacter xylosoxidans]
MIANAAAVALLAAIGVAAWWLASQPEGGRGLSLSLLLGAAFGIVLQRSRFCFYCIARDAIERRDPAGAYAVLVALAVGTLGYHAVFGAFLPIPAAERLPPGAHIGPVSLALVAGAFVFGVGMRISGSCISAHFYRLGEGALASPFALLGAGLGFVLGFASWNALYLVMIQQAPVVWLPHHLGYGGTVLLQGAALVLLALGLGRLGRRAPPLRPVDGRLPAPPSPQRVSPRPRQPPRRCPRHGRPYCGIVGRRRSAACWWRSSASSPICGSRR